MVLWGCHAYTGNTCDRSRRLSILVASRAPHTTPRDDDVDDDVDDDDDDDDDDDARGRHCHDR